MLTIYLSFVPFYSARFPAWTKIGSWIHVIAVHVIFILVPLLSIGNTLIHIEAVWKSRAIGWLLTYLLINLMTIIYYFISILKIVRGARQFVKDRSVRPEQIQADDDKKEAEDVVNYFNIWRGHGEGPMRIGTRIDIGADLYSLLFMACVR